MNDSAYSGLSKAGGFGGLLADGVFALFAQPAQMSVAASSIGHACMHLLFISSSPSPYRDNFTGRMKNQ